MMLSASYHPVCGSLGAVEYDALSNELASAHSVCGGSPRHGANGRVVCARPWALDGPWTGLERTLVDFGGGWSLHRILVHP